MIEPKKVFQFRKVETGSLKETVLPHSFELRLDIAEDLPYFNGHFPQNPVLPGVAIIDASIEGLKVVMDRPLIYLKKVQSAKFMDLVRPRDQVRLNFIEREPSVWMISWWPAHPASAGANATVSKKLSEIIVEIEVTPS